MFLKYIVTFFFIYIINPAQVMSYDTCNEFTITFDEIIDIENIKTFESGSFGLLNNLTKQCRNLNIAIELDLYREEGKSKLYKNLYGDDLHKINVTYPLDSNVLEEVLTPACPEICENPNKEDRSYYNTILKPVFSPKRIPEIIYPTTEVFVLEDTSEPTTGYPYFSFDFDTTTESITESTDNGGNKTGAERLKNEKEEGDNTAVIIALGSVAGVATVGVASYFAAQMIKTMLQSGSFRFPDPA